MDLALALAIAAVRVLKGLALAPRSSPSAPRLLLTNTPQSSPIGSIASRGMHGGGGASGLHRSRNSQAPGSEPQPTTETSADGTTDPNAAITQSEVRIRLPPSSRIHISGLEPPLDEDPARARTDVDGRAHPAVGRRYRRRRDEGI